MSTPAPAAQPSLLAVAAMLRAAIGAGLDVRSATAAVGGAVDGERGQALAVGAAALAIGVPWSEAWAQLDGLEADLVGCLEPAWRAGASPGPALDAWSGAAVTRGRTAGALAAAALDARLSLPVSLCLLPAFVLVGVVPLLIALVGAVLRDATQT